MSAWLWLALACTKDAKTDPDGAPGPTDTGTGTGDTGCREALAEGFVDEDGDGFGDPARPVSCDPAAVAEGTDCDDTNPEIRPGLAERCDGIDNDCDPATPEEGLVTRVDASELHALVRTMVRNELQGSLGERITRNVRKLVRTEINRALAARSLD